ncbi:MAG: enoyl-CoA hydratase/isomerase family protein [Gammaproteobacteria bacterium]|nr:enoyl-CoA hydratase/isomerase family protein [Gammaproteobacteria bacterium]
MGNASTVILQCRDQVATLTLNDASRHNALGHAELGQLGDALDTIAGDASLRAVLLTGAGEKTFCAGAALDQLDGVHFDGDTFAPVTDKLAALPLPTVCALNGNVFGAGVDLALACDFRLGVVGSRMRVPAAVLGACYPPGCVQRMVAQLGVAASRRLLLMAETLDADAMLACGFLQWQVAREQLHARAQLLLDQLLALAPKSLSAMKSMIGLSAVGLNDAQAAQELMSDCFASEDFSEGMAAQREARAPKFSGN